MGEERPAKAAPNSVILGVGSLLTAVAPMVGAFLIRGFDSGLPPLWATLALVGGTVLLVPVAWLAPAYLLVSLVPIIMVGFMYLLFMRRDVNRPASLMLDRDDTWPIAVTVLWALVLVAVAWRTRAYWVDALRIDIRRDAPAGRWKARFHLFGGVVAIAAGAGLMVMLMWNTVWNIAHFTATRPATYEVTVEEAAMFTHTQPGTRTSRARDSYWVLSDADGERFRLDKHRDVIEWERAVGQVWSREQGYYGCADPNPEPGDTVIFEGRDSPVGFAVDGVAAVYRNGDEVCNVATVADDM